MFAMVEEERSSLDRSLLDISNCKIQKRKDHVPVVLLGIDISPENIFNTLTHSLILAINLRMR